MIIPIVIPRLEHVAPALSPCGTRKGWEIHFFFQLFKNHPNLSYFQLVKLQNLPQFVKLKICFHFMKLKFLFSVLCETYFFLKACLHCENWQVTKVNTFCSLWNLVEVWDTENIFAVSKTENLCGLWKWKRICSVWKWKPI